MDILLMKFCYVILVTYFELVNQRSRYCSGTYNVDVVVKGIEAL